MERLFVQWLLQAGWEQVAKKEFRRGYPFKKYTPATFEAELTKYFKKTKRQPLVLWGETFKEGPPQYFVQVGAVGIPERLNVVFIPSGQTIRIGEAQ